MAFGLRGITCSLSTCYALHTKSRTGPDGLNASVAAGRVGYESASQFSREFKRFFGRSPVEEATHMSQLVAVMPGLQGGAQRLPMPVPQRYVTVD